MFMLTTRTLFCNYRQGLLNCGIMGAACTLFLLSIVVSTHDITMHLKNVCPEWVCCKQEMSMNIARLYQGFISKGQTLYGGP